MNREIKFRARGGNTMYFFELKDLYNEGLEVNLRDHDSKHLAEYTQHPYTGMPIMKFTGLPDKNGIEIYEGEILFNDDRKECCVVKYDEEKAMFITEYVETKDKFPLWESISNLYYSVGNIYQNKELLNK